MKQNIRSKLIRLPKRQTKPTVTIFPTRINMLGLAKKEGRFCELGALKGDFAEIILGVCNPSELVLVDIWPKTVMSGDVNGNNLEEFKGEYLYKYVTDRFKKLPSVTIRREKTTLALKKYSDSYFDTIYIDADHTYKAVIKDLEWAYKKTKSGGFIMGHDYEINPEKTDARYDFGVQRAVDEFCEKYNQKIYAKAKDGCVSYAIKVQK